MARVSLLVFAAVIGCGCAALPAQTIPLSLPPSEEVPTYQPTMTFDVASIREVEAVPGFQMAIDNPPHASTFHVNGMPMRFLIQLAYGFGPFQVSSMPEWADRMLVAVQAKGDASADAQLAKLSDSDARLEKRHMLQAMVADRLKLKTHWEQREGSVYNLVLAKGGSKLEPTKVEDPVPGEPAPVANALGPEVHATGDKRGREIQCKRFSMRAVTAMLGSQLQKPVVDKTGLTGTYDFVLRFNTDNSTEPDAYPGVFAALEEELGLKLEGSRGPMDVLVIDHVERPSDN